MEKNEALRSCPCTQKSKHFDRVHAQCAWSRAHIFWGIRGLGKTLTLGLATDATTHFSSAKERSRARIKYN